MLDEQREPLERALQRILWEFRPYLNDVVIIGGWVPYLHQRYGHYPSWHARLSLTAEVDTLLPSTLPVGSRPPLKQILTDAGFRPEVHGPTAAVWINDPQLGEKIEFLVPHEGPVSTSGTIIPLQEQSGIGAMALERLDILARHTTVLKVMAMGQDETVTPVDVRVPTLAAYVINKSITFLKRRPHASGQHNPKQAKDLLYLRDLMAAGTDVVSRIEDDIADMLMKEKLTEGHRDQFALDSAANALTTLPQIAVLEAAAMLAERDGGSMVAGEADVRGYLTDLGELLGRHQSPPPSLPSNDEEE
jgi:hypothetical protein